MTLLVFLNAGACSSYGTVVEPCNWLQKFPSPQDYFYQARGFSLAECYYMSLANPYQGLIVGEPLAAPFARPPVGAWVNLPANSGLSGITNLTLQCAASTSNHPIQQVDLFLDGTWLQTLTNIPPAAGNQLYVTINGCTTNYLVPSNATIASVASGLADVLNQPAYVRQLEFAYKGVLLGVRGKGIRGLPTYKEQTIGMPPGAILVFYTDGLTDRRTRADGSGHYSEAEAGQMLPDTRSARLRPARADPWHGGAAPARCTTGDQDDDIAMLRW